MALHTPGRWTLALKAMFSAMARAAALSTYTAHRQRPWESTGTVAMARMARSDPRAAFKVLEGSWRELVEPLRDGVIDIIVGALRPYEIADLYQLPLTEDRLVIAAGSQHPLAGVEKPSMEQLAAYPWIVAPANSPLREQWENLFAEVPTPSTPVECGSVMIIGRLLTEANFLTLLSPDQVALQIRSGLLTQVGPALEGTKRVVGITTRRSWRPTATQRRFLEMLGDAATGETAEGGPSDLRASGWV